MNTSRLLIAVAAVTLVAGTGGAFAQQAPTQRPITPIVGHNTNLTFDTSPGNHARIREIFGKDRSAKKADHVNFSLSVGAVVPRSVRLAALPQTIIAIQPTWRGDEYFRVGHQIVVVDPQSKEILGVLAI
jgi:hypothetical protein